MKQQDRTSYRKENDDCWSALERTLQARGKKKKCRLCYVPLAMNTAVLIARGKDFADDRPNLNTEISAEHWKHFMPLHSTTE